MDLHLRHAAPTNDERAAVDALLGPPRSAWDGGVRGDIRDAHTAAGGREAREQRHLLLPALEALQSRVGWISETGLDYVCSRLNVPPADAWGVATFYALLSTSPRAPRVLHVCDDIACRCKGATELIEQLERTLGPAHSHSPHGEQVAVDPNGAVWMRSPCLGLCDHAPAAFVQEAGAEPKEYLIGNAESVINVMPVIPLLRYAQGRVDTTQIPQRGDPSLVLLKRVGVVDPSDITAYRASGGFDALRKAIDLGPDAIIREVTDSKLLGRGGAA